MVYEKVVRSWRMQLGKPFGVHLWFDPDVESVVLLSEPTGFVDISEKEVTDGVDLPAQMSYLGKGNSVSGQAGELFQPKNPNGNERRTGRNRPSLPSELKEKH